MKFKNLIVFALFLLWACSSKPSAANSDPQSSQEIECIPTPENMQDIVVNAPENDKARFAVISKQTMTLGLFDSRSNMIRKYPIACGKGWGDKEKEGDMRTPEGVFKVLGVQDASTWSHDFKDGKGVIKGAYGPNFIRLSTPPHTGIGIHGTHDPSSIGTRASEGCIRMHNADVADFVKYVYSGMPIIIVGSEKDIAENAKFKRVTADVTSSGSFSKSPKTQEPKSVSAPPKKINEPTKEQTAPQKTKSGEYTVKKGDKPEKIAKAHGMSVDEFLKLNGMNVNSKIKIGQTVKVKK